MVNVVRSADCGNSPKNAFLERLAIAIATRDAKAVRDCIADDARWIVVGTDPIAGKERIAAALEHAHADRIARVTIGRVVSHGKAGAVNGTVEYTSGRTVEFCDMYDFASAKGSSVARITSYAVEV
jgi:hypothetical protein